MIYNLTFNGKDLGLNGKNLAYDSGLPPFTIRLKFKEGTTPSFSKGTAVQVSSSPNIWDLTYNNPDWVHLCSAKADLLEVVSANTSGVKNMHEMFYYCWSLTTVSLFDTSNVTSMEHMFSSCPSLRSVPLFNTAKVTDMRRMFYICRALTSVPLFNTSKVTDISGMFYGCYKVQSGALALYRQASTQATPPAIHDDAFTDCGRDTTTGAAELAQIPTDWGGTMT